MVPLAVTENVAVCPARTAWFAGCFVMDGGALTVRTALLLVTLPATFVTVTENNVPLFDSVVTGVVYEESVAPSI